MSRSTLDPALSSQISHTGLSPSLAGLSSAILLSLMNQLCGPKPRSARTSVWALPVSLAATPRIDVSFFSSGYLDVSVRRVRLRWPMDSARDTSKEVGFPIRTSRDQCSIASSPALFAGLHVLRRLSSPRHPPDALIHLTLSFQEPL